MSIAKRGGPLAMKPLGPPVVILICECMAVYPALLAATLPMLGALRRVTAFCEQ